MATSVAIPKGTEAHLISGILLMNGYIIRLLLLPIMVAVPLIALCPFVYGESPKSSRPSDVVAARSPRELIGIASKKTTTAETNRDFGEIIYYLDKALASKAIVPEHRQYARQLKGWTHNRLGENFSQQGKEAAALTQFELAVDLNFKHWKALHNRGVSYAMGERFDEALQDFASTIRIHPEYANAWFNRAEVFMRLGKTAIAIENYTQAIALNADDPGYYKSRGKAYRIVRKYPQAHADLDQSLALDSQSATIYIERGDLWLAEGNFEKSAADYRSAVYTDKQSAAAFQRIAWMMATCPDIRYRDAKRAILFSQRAIQLHGEKDFRYLDTLAAAHANADEFDLAIEQQTVALKLAEGNATGRELKHLKQRLEQYSRNIPHREERIASRLDQPKQVQ